MFKDPEFKAKMTAQMDALRHDEAFYTWLKMMLAPEAQVPRLACGICPLAVVNGPSLTRGFRVRNRLN